jgi:hypothetical protein
VQTAYPVERMTPVSPVLISLSSFGAAEVSRHGRVGYIHCKGVQRQPQRWIAVPMTQSSAAWRTMLRSLPGNVPCAIEYPLIGDDLLDVTRTKIQALRAIMGETGNRRMDNA